MKTCVFTPTHETGILMADIIPYAGSHDTRLGRESSWPLAPAGAHVFFRPLRVKGLFCALAGRAAFLFRRNPMESACPRGLRGGQDQSRTRKAPAGSKRCRAAQS